LTMFLQTFKSTAMRLPPEFENFVRDMRFRPETRLWAGDGISIHIAVATVLIKDVWSLLAWI
jgi:hypothetical protein